MKELFGPLRAARFYRPSRPEVDAVVVTPGAVILIEAKIKKYMDGLSKLPVYKIALMKAPEFKPILPGKHVLMQLLLPFPIPWVVEAAKEMGVEVIVWAPDWVIRRWEDYDKYWTAEWRIKRERDKRLRRALGQR